MSKYGNFFNGPGSSHFPGWPSKQPGMPSGTGRYNNPSSSAGFVPSAPLPANSGQLPHANVYGANGWLIPPGPLSIVGSAHARSAVFHNDQLYTLSVVMNDGGKRDYCCVPFQHIYLLRAAADPGAYFDHAIFPIFPYVLC